MLDRGQREGSDILGLCLDSEVSTDPLPALSKASYSRAAGSPGCAELYAGSGFWADVTPLAIVQ